MSWGNCVGSIGPGGPCSIGPGGGLSIGPGGGRSIGPGGGLSIGPGGGRSIGPGGGLSIGPGGGRSIGPNNKWRPVPGGGNWKSSFQYGLTAAQSGNFTTAFSEWLPLAEQGIAAAQYSLGILYHNGHGVSQDYQNAAILYSLAAEQGFAAAQNNLGHLLLNGLGVNKDPKRALFYLQEATFNGLKGGYAETTIGWSYFTGEYTPVIPKNYAQSLYWNKRGAEAGNTNAHSNMALHYFGGFGVEQSFSKMLDHLIKSAELFDESFKWVTEGPDEWNEFRYLAPARFWNARKKYWIAISTGQDFYIDDLRSLR